MATEKRLIDADALMDAFRGYMVEYYDREKCVSEENCKTCESSCLWRKIVSVAPTVDAVEVCRCKDCKHYKPQNQGAHRNCTTPYCMRVVAVKVSPDDFCSYGEKREVI